MELNKNRLHDLLGKVVNEMGAAANGPLITSGGFSHFRRVTEPPFNLILEARP